MEALILTYTYWIIVPLAIIEGPVITLAASFLASLGLLNIFLVYLAVLAGDIIGDIIHYVVGRFGGRGIVRKFGHYFKITEEKVDNAKEKYFKNKSSVWRVITLSKITHAPSSVVMLAAGVAKVDFKQFLLVTTVNNVFKVLVFVIVGFFFGKSYLAIEAHINNSWVFFVPVFLIIIYFLYSRK